jgi:hypothetical protein
MRQSAAPWLSLYALDQSGIQFPLLPEEVNGLAQPTSRSLARVISSWRLSIATARPAPDDALDQWGIEFPIADGEFAGLAGYRRRGRLQARGSVLGSVLGGHRRGISQAGAWAAILAVVVAGSAPAVNPPASAGAAPPHSAPTGGQPALIGGADPTQIGSLPSITEQLSTFSNPTLGPTPGATSNPTPGPTPGATSNPTFGPTPGATSSAEAIAIMPVSNIPASDLLEARPSQVWLIVVPTIQDARNYLVARLGAKVDRHWGMAQSQCASLIFEYEARWNPHATNKSSGAYGLPQANPASKLANWAEAMATAAANAGDPEAALLYRAWRDNPVVQAEWGVDYMIKRYGSPCAALAFRSGVGWY